MLYNNESKTSFGSILMEVIKTHKAEREKKL